jgi:hypothetical protein
MSKSASVSFLSSSNLPVKDEKPCGLEEEDQIFSFPQNQLESKVEGYRQK